MRERAHLAFGDDDGFAKGMARAAASAHLLAAELAKFDATWEPHDWTEFD